MPLIYRCEVAPSLHWRRWDDEYVVFDAVTGDTHAMDAPTAALLRRLSVGPADLDALVVDGGAEVAVEVKRALDRLCAAGLVTSSRE